MNAVVPERLPDGLPQVLAPFVLGAVRVESAAFSAAGSRPYNEDRLSQQQVGAAAFWALADGLGGHQGGAQAAALAVESGLSAAASGLLPGLEERLKEAVSKAHAAVRAEQKSSSGFTDMRSTLVLLGLMDGDFAWAHCGDSRLYHFNEGRLAWRTRDHSAAQLLATAGEIVEADISFHPERSRLVSCLGGRNPLLIGSRRAGRSPAAGDRFLLCSDGLWENFRDEDLAAAATAAENPEALLRELGRRVMAAAHPGQDNYSAVAVFIARA